ncbi:MAG: MarR family transcriptional regulator, partial [Microbacterium sp. 14-71-5]
MVCFALYAATRATTQAYRALLEPWGLTYPQYLVLVTLWLDGEQTVSSLGDRLQLDSGTLSPLLRRMESSDLIVRERRSSDERVV